MSNYRPLSSIGYATLAGPFPRRSPQGLAEPVAHPGLRLRVNTRCSAALIAFASGFAAVALRVPAAWAATPPEVRLYIPDGEPVAGVSTEVEVAVAVDGRPAERASVELAAVAGTVGLGAPAGEGRWRWPYTPGTDKDTLRVRVDGGEWTAMGVAPSALSKGRLAAAPAIEAAVGEPLVFRFPLLAPVSPSELVVRASEGTLAVEADTRELRVTVTPGPDRGARVIAVGVADRGQPGGGAVFGVARLRAKQSAALNVGVGSTVQIKVGRRTYGPFAADATGVAHVSFEVLPGETRFDISAADDLGNTQKVQSPLPANLAPVIVGVDLATGRLAGARLSLGVWTAAGLPWSGDGPTCRGPTGEVLAVRPAGVGAWQVNAALPPDSLASAFDLRVDCAVGESAARFRIPLADVLPARVELRAYPDTVSTDFPVAQVQALLLDARGDRLPPDGLTLNALLGQLESGVEDGALRADYQGDAAVAFGKDTIRAEWRAPSGTGATWDLDLRAAAVPGGVEVRARALDALGRPLGGVAVHGTLEGDAWTAVTGVNGWAATVVGRPAGGVWLLRGEASGIARSTAIFAAGSASLPDLQAPDLASELVLPIQSGRVRRVQLDVSPRPLVTGAGVHGRVTVRLFDGVGAPVRDEPVTVTATAGTIVQGAILPDGTVEAWYTPPQGALAGVVTITAATTSSTVDTELELVPRPVTGSFGLDVGWVSNLGSISSPTFAVTMENALPFLPDPVSQLLRARLSVGTHALSTQLVDPVSGLEADVSARFVPVSLGMVAESRVGKRTLEVGLSGVLAPYGLSTAFDSRTALVGSGLASPGLQLHAGAAYRAGISEIYGEARYLFLNSPAGRVSFEGSVGGVSLSAGYRVLY